MKQKKIANQTRQTLKRTNFPKYKSRLYRSSWLARTRKLGVDKKLVPTTLQIEKWLIDQVPYVCYYTGAKLGLNFEADHKVPLSRGGSPDLNNICLCTPAMNGAKGNLTDKEFKQLLKLISKWDDSAGKSLLARLRRGHF